MPVVEIISFPASQAYLDNPDVLAPALEVLAPVPGVINLYTGTRIESPKVVYILIQWESPTHRTSFHTSPTHPLFTSLSSPSSSPSSSPTTRLASFPSPPTNTLTAPLTEICILKPKLPSNAAHIAALAAGLTEKLLTPGVVRGCYGAEVEVRVDCVDGVDGGSGEGTGEGEGLVWLIGWHDLQAHADAAKDEPDVLALINLAEIDVSHVPLKKHV